MIKFVDLMGSISTGVTSCGPSKYKWVIPACGYLRRMIGHGDGEFGNALLDDLEGEYLALSTLLATTIPNRVGAANRYKGMSAEVGIDFSREILGMSDKECASQQIEKDI